MKFAVVLLTLLASTADASSCRPPAPFILPRATIEEGGLLFLFLPTNGGWNEPEDFERWQRTLLEELWVEAGADKALPFELKLVSRGDAFDVFSLKVKAKVGTEFVVRPALSSFAITVVKRSKPLPVRLELTPGSDDNFTNSVSTQQIRRLIPSLDAPAFRVRWHGGSVVVPGKVPYGRDIEPGLQLGRVYCSGTTAWWTTPTKFTITALLSDGREVIADPVMLEPPPFRKFP